MKPVYNFLQDYAAFVCLFFGIVPYLSFTIIKDGSTFGNMWIIFIASAIVFALCLWWLSSKWILKKPANMTAVTFASVLGVMISFSALIGMYSDNYEFYILCMGTPTGILQVLMIVALILELLRFNPFKKK